MAQSEWEELLMLRRLVKEQKQTIEKQQIQIGNLTQAILQARKKCSAAPAK